MRAALVIAALLTLPACVIGQGAYDDYARTQCDQLPTPNERLQCERDAADAASDRRYNEQRGTVQRGRYTLPADVCPAEDEDACDFH